MIHSENILIYFKFRDILQIKELSQKYYSRTNKHFIYSCKMIDLIWMVFYHSSYYFDTFSKKQTSWKTVMQFLVMSSRSKK